MFPFTGKYQISIDIEKNQDKDNLDTFLRYVRMNLKHRNATIMNENKNGIWFKSRIQDQNCNFSLMSLIESGEFLLHKTETLIELKYKIRMARIFYLSLAIPILIFVFDQNFKFVNLLFVSGICLALALFISLFGAFRHKKYFNEIAYNLKRIIIKAAANKSYSK